MVKKVLLSVASLALAVTLVGCNGNQTAKVNTEDWKGMNLKVAGYRKFNDDPLNYEYAEGAKKFAEKYGTAEVEFMVGGKDGNGDDLAAAIAAGDPWDLQYCFGVSIFPSPIAQGLYTDITEYLDKDHPMLTAATLEGAKWKGKYYGVSNVGMQEFSYSSYNETWFKELGVKTPMERYKDGEWTQENFIQMVAELKKKGANVGMNSGRPNVVGRYLSSWDDNGKVTVTYDSQKNIDWLNMWRLFAYDEQYKIGNGKAALRTVAYMDEVFPNLLKQEVQQETNDVIRYIQFPQVDNKPGTYLTDSCFVVPNGVKEEKIAAAVELAAYMCNEKSVLVDETYKANMNEEDYKLLHENLDNAYFLPRFFTGTLWKDLQAKWGPDARAGKPVSTHIAENIDWLKAQADQFNRDYVEGK